MLIFIIIIFKKIGLQYLLFWIHGKQLPNEDLNIYNFDYWLFYFPIFLVDFFLV